MTLDICYALFVSKDAAVSRKPYIIKRNKIDCYRPLTECHICRVLKLKSPQIDIIRTMMIVGRVKG